MSQSSHRREFLQEVGGGMLAVLVGPTLAAELGLAAEDTKDDKAKPSPAIARIAEIVQQSPTDRLLGALDEQMKKGATLRQLIAGGAIANARVRAEQYAEAAGAEVGDILRIVEGSVSDPVVFREAAPMAADASGVAIAPGSQDLSADVTVVFAMS